VYLGLLYPSLTDGVLIILSGFVFWWTVRNLLFELLEPNPFLSLEPVDIKKVKATKFMTSPNMLTGKCSYYSNAVRPSPF